MNFTCRSQAKWERFRTLNQTSELPEPSSGDASLKIAILTTDNREYYKDYANPVPYFGTAPEALLQGFAGNPDLQVHVLSCAQKPIASPKNLAPNIIFHGFHVPKLGWMRTGYQGCIRAIRRKLRQLQPDLVHGQGTERDCAISAVFSGFPNVTTIHGNMAELARLFKAPIGSFSWLAARLENFTLKRTLGVFCNSLYTEQLVRPRALRTWRVANAIRERFFAPISEPVEPRPCVLLNVGVISPRKRQLELLAVIEQLHHQQLHFQFLFIGHADRSLPYAAAFLEKIKPLESLGVARYVGPQNLDQLFQSFDASSALVHFPSEEAFGLVVAEGLARNLKFFGSRTGGIIDIAGDAAEAQLFNLEDWDGLTAALAVWIRSGFPRPRDAANLMRARYHPVVIARRHVEIYQEVLASHRCVARSSS